MNDEIASPGYSPEKAPGSQSLLMDSAPQASQSTARHAASARSSAALLLMVYGAIIIYASLSPLRGWRRPKELFGFLWAPWPTYVTDFDLLINILVYVPLGFLTAVYVAQTRSARVALLIGTLLPTALSVVLELLQSFMPHIRFASNLDVICNALGATCGAAFAAWMSKHSGMESTLMQFRARHFQPGIAVDIGLALVLVWLLSQLNPSIPLLGAGLITRPISYPWQVIPSPPIVWLPQAAAVALNFVGIGLFLSSLMSSRVRGLVSALLLIFCAFLFKALAAAALLKPFAVFSWLQTGTAAGIAIGLLLLLTLAGLPLKARVAISAIVILAGAMMAKLTGVYVRPRQVLPFFDWPYGQLLNFTGLTHYLNEAWPALALIFLIGYFPTLRAKTA